MPEERQLKILVDVKQKKVACVLLQAAYHVPYSDYSKVCHLFNDWIVFPTDDLRIVSGTMQEWENHATKMNSKKI